MYRDEPTPGRRWFREISPQNAVRAIGKKAYARRLKQGPPTKLTIGHLDDLSIWVAIQYFSHERHQRSLDRWFEFNNEIDEDEEEA